MRARSGPSSLATPLLSAGLMAAIWLAGCGGDTVPLPELYDTGYGHLQRGDLTAAADAARQGQERAQNLDRATWRRAFAVLEAEVLASRRQDPEALALLEGEGGSTGPPDAVEVRSLMTRGLIACRGSAADGFEVAQALLQRASDAAATLGSAALQGEIELRRGTCLFLRGRLGEAEAHFEQALATARGEGLLHLETNASGSLGLVRIRTGRFDEATEWLTRSLESAEKIGAHISRAKTVNNLGWCYFELGDYERAFTTLQQAEVLSEGLGLDGDRLVALTNLGRTLYKERKYPEAAEYFQRALDLAEQLGDRRRTARLRSNLAAAALGEQDYDTAETHVEAALSIKAELGDVVGEQHSLLTQSQILMMRGQLSEAEELCRGVITSPHTEPDLLWEAHGALAQLYGKSGRLEQAEEQLEIAYRLMDESRDRLRSVGHRLSFFSSLKDFYDLAVLFLVNAGHHEQALELVVESRGRLLRESLRLAPAKSAHPLTASDLRGLAAETDAVLLTYWTGLFSFLWAITPSEIHFYTLSGEETLRADVEAYQEAILRSGDPLAEAPPEADRLWRTLVAPAIPHIPPGSRIIAEVDGPLHQLNLETLVAPEPEPHYWIEDVTLVSTPSLSYLRSLPSDPANSSGHRLEPAFPSILLIGDPLSPNANFPRLAHAGLEMQRIAELFEPDLRTVYSGVHAAPTAFASAEPGRFAYIHFAAHVTANRQIPLESAVILSPDGESYKLYARDVLKTPLTAELVTLSACRSAGSRTFAGEGLVGLAWAFMNAGARNVIGGLWDVEDASTSELMEELYRGLAEGLEPAEALRQAKLGLLRSPTAYRKPFYWAPFVTYRGPNT